MNSRDTLTLYEKIKDDMKFLTGSDIRSKIILSLNERKMNLSDLRSKLHLNSSTILHAMSQLEEKNLIFKKENGYSISQTGKISVSGFIKLSRLFNTIQNCEKLFLNHQIESIPPHLIENIGLLDEAYIVESVPTDVMKPHTALSQLLMKTKTIKVISSIFYLPNIELYNELLKKNVDIELILTENVLSTLKDTMGRENLEKLVSTGNLRLKSINNKVKLSFTVGEKFIALGLFSDEGIYDLNMYLVGEDEDSLLWGNILFDHYLKQAEEVKL